MGVFGLAAFLLAGAGCIYMGWRRRRRRPVLAWILMALGIIWLALIVGGIVQDAGHDQQRNERSNKSLQPTPAARLPGSLSSVWCSAAGAAELGR
jgi:hypothetical protein